MERLTIRGDHGIYMADGYDFEINPDDYDLVQKILDRLAAYEDTGMDPEEIVSMRHTLNEYHKEADLLLRAKVEGRLVVLPCKVGDTVYRIFAPDGWKRKPVIFMHTLTSVNDIVRWLPKFGKTVFLTHEEAERALVGGGSDARSVSDDA